MTLRTYNPFDLQVDRLFDEAFRTAGRTAAWVPAVNAWEDAERLSFEMSLPGWDSKDVKITVEDGVLTLEGTRPAETPVVDRTYFVHEMTWGNFTRSFTLPTHVNAEKAVASFKDGVLTLEFPKREEAKPRKITIEAR